MRLIILVALFVTSAVIATPLEPTFSSCLSSYSPVAPVASQLNVTAIYANLVAGIDASRLGLTGGGHNVLRVDLIGTTGEEVLGYNGTTNKLGKPKPVTSVRQA